jgi:hypothetical protein
MPPTSHEISIPNDTPDIYKTDDPDDPDDTYVDIDALTKYILDKKLCPNIKRGDTIILEEKAGYRNNGVYMWDGKKVIRLYTEIDDYGSVPPEIEITDDDFDPRSWHFLVDHNGYVWFSPEIRERICEDLTDKNTATLLIRKTKWTFQYSPGYGNTTTMTTEEIRQALMQNRCYFEMEDPDQNMITFYVSNSTHGVVRQPDLNKVKEIRVAEFAAYMRKQKRIRKKIASLETRLASLDARMNKSKS